eukprot:3041623-Rhodomonas_salina.1
MDLVDPCADHGQSTPPRNPIQDFAFLVQTALKLWFHKVDFMSFSCPRVYRFRSEEQTWDRGVFFD